MSRRPWPQQSGGGDAGLRRLLLALVCAATFALVPLSTSARSRPFSITIAEPRVPARFVFKVPGLGHGPKVSEIVVSDTERNRGVCGLRREEAAPARPLERWRYGEALAGFTMVDCKEPLRPGRYGISVVADEAAGTASFNVRADGAVVVEP
jgi:hypothetical protein